MDFDIEEHLTPKQVQAFAYLQDDTTKQIYYGGSADRDWET